MLDNSFRRLGADEARTNLGGDEWANEWPTPAAWDFVAVGKGHNAAYWAEFRAALYEVDPNMIVNIEHEDTSLGGSKAWNSPRVCCSKPHNWPASNSTDRMKP